MKFWNGKYIGITEGNISEWIREIYGETYRETYKETYISGGNIGKYRSGKHRETYIFSYKFCSMIPAAIQSPTRSLGISFTN